MVFHADYEPALKRRDKCEIRVGDLVRVQDYDWIEQGVGIVTEVRELVYDQTGDTYYTVTATINGQEYTFSHKDFELVSKTERDSK